VVVLVTQPQSIALPSIPRENVVSRICEGHPAIGERDSRCRRGAECGANARNDFIFNSGFTKASISSPARPKIDGSRLSAGQHPARSAIRNQERVDFMLGKEFVAGALAHVNDLGGGRNHRQDSIANERIVQDNTASASRRAAFKVRQFGITRPRANEINLADHAMHSPRPSFRE